MTLLDTTPDALAPSMPLTAPQYGMWAGQRLEPESASFWTAEAVELTGEADIAALEQSIVTTLRRCDALHMRYREDARADSLTQRLDPAREVPLPHRDFSAEPDPRQAAWAWMTQDLRQPAALDEGPLFATALLRLGPDHCLWYLRAHHIALDGFAYLLLIHRVAEHYSALRRNARVDPGRDWSLQRVVDEELRYRVSDRFERDKDFWASRLADAPAPVKLAPLTPPCDSARSERHLLPLSLYARWQDGARACGVDWTAWLVAGIAAWMHRRSGADHIAIGLLVMNRLGSAAIGIPCMAMNVVPLQVRVGTAERFDDLARRVASEIRALRPHQRYNYERMREDMGLGGTHKQLYGPVVNLMPFDRGFVFEGLQSRTHPVSVGAVEDMDITVSPLSDGLRFDIEANPDAYDTSTLRKHHRSLMVALEAALQRPDAGIGTLTVPREAAMPAGGAFR